MLLMRLFHQAVRGNARDYNFDAVYFIGILDFCPPDNESETCVRRIALKDDVTVDKPVGLTTFADEA